MNGREQFTSRLGFIAAATGSAVGLGNIWGFPTQTANNGGAVFVLLYIVFVVILGYPALMAELVIGRHARSNMVTALPLLSSTRGLKAFGKITGLAGVTVASLILAFYSIVAGWMIAFTLSTPFKIAGISSYASWFTDFSVSRNFVFCLFFLMLTVLVVAGGVKNGIERWSTRLLPLLILLMVMLTGYVFTLEGATAGLKVYLIPDPGHIAIPDLVNNAMGQAFFSLSLGVGTMLIYGSYIRAEDNLAVAGAMVAVTDTSVALLAGLLIIPAMYVAQEHGVDIYDGTGALVAGPDLILQVLPVLFNDLGSTGATVSVVFFSLLTIAALTSSISMLEVPVAFFIEHLKLSRMRATCAAGATIFLLSALIVFYFDSLFTAVVDLTTKYSQPILAAILCAFVGWVIRRDILLNHIRMGYHDVETSWFWKIWPTYVRYVCPCLVIFLFIQALSR